jgi:hypothetical protein
VAGSAPALTAIRGELNAILDEGRSAFNGSREFKHGSKELKKIDPDGRLTSMVNRLWYRYAFLVNAKYLGGGSDLIKECILVLTVLCEVRQSVVDVFEYSKSMGDKVRGTAQHGTARQPLPRQSQSPHKRDLGALSHPRES